MIYRNLYEVKVRYNKINEKSGKEMTAKETYLIQGVTFGDAEKNIYTEMEKLVSGEFDVTNINRVTYSDILNTLNGDKWYKSKVSFVSLDDATGKEKKVTNLILVPADNVDEATERVKESLKTLIVDYEIVSVAESPIVDFFIYEN